MTFASEKVTQNVRIDDIEPGWRYLCKSGATDVKLFVLPGLF